MPDQRLRSNIDGRVSRETMHLLRLVDIYHPGARPLDDLILIAAGIRSTMVPLEEPGGKRP